MVCNLHGSEGLSKGFCDRIDLVRHGNPVPTGRYPPARQFHQQPPYFGALPAAAKPLLLPIL